MTDDEESWKSFCAEFEKAWEVRSAAAKEWAWCSVGDVWSECESEIERKLAPWLALVTTDIFRWRETRLEDEPSVLTNLRAQAEIGPYRVDFLMEARGTIVPFEVRIAIECDGHDFHERTKEQARRDKTRDRYLMEHGFLVARFTGAEIWKDPRACAEGVIRILTSECVRQAHIYNDGHARAFDAMKAHSGGDR